MALLLAARPSVQVRLWSAFEENHRILRETRENQRFLPGVMLPDRVELTTQEAAATDGADLWITAIPTIHLRSTIRRFAAFATPQTAVLSLTKGIEAETFLRPSEILSEILGTDRLAVLSGPSHAEEVARGMPTSVAVSAQEAGLAEWIQSLLSSERFRIYTNSDRIGVELAGALKNVIGIAAGISDGLGYGDNAKSALLTRGLTEMTRFSTHYGAQSETFHGLAGMGDLITTCFSRHGRNRWLGEQLGRGLSLDAILASTRLAVEGVNTCRSVHDRCRNDGLEMPITSEVYRVLFEGKTPRQAVTDLMHRLPRAEQI
ncbi:glycerol-3-phosphate dehydrogenase : Glycerol-3-phosphate dehydrogenase [NAD(P)+] OS=Singulisphaera acidiphila (strain ATCC BAA-1392 / DSM 18658 / VKM B-2454 / MOB10) GN=gpsA PE=3 SV=1: NAD_Gly3P_dh_N: NAD_Gly3P_dh_C [Tuwongella immobilis]|uniref:Glycerol-3-phosphate dehydrogenase [NAD(P)+] n=2 Tax=Tuwongella immobilis TaxID=692036 RepID=A0A6C2YPI7_9BACT|nr:glycerol-3-phosphate dehydrogenase : Glycerol-3-phosphate dehydrogenase [NAD(P)+] OS=Singulisphaera acidiphila (strain ATCC BAA-1392 / DSM 18658 / VKM B-2454 / MOB10) GN=gpsA PE=3 SV=1: NAD_Gly3P_dh_N: NAD_Gly3P_dh_C [Tuwongella immobilis]VTS04428.1 glycerol-3-phosphate dehydrogenase : Glycerol-3-phosphate dehydrogenase [NAD(P)+] OS=Singulisphaera acidiphila (strain ATCC BAA-1392 / DSM 18658 / VKM B-2454 / MOB10) GN=gpsA PE=3 SV=1: NAD_Gly3P_dh_N: NAD_Gly3P_dh_C [Tuwongella immobilis]